MNKPNLLHYEEVAWESGFFYVVGVDEAGRGPLAGPVIAAAVCFTPKNIRSQLNNIYKDLNDSKKLTPNLREHYFKILTEDTSVKIGIGEVDSKTIDQVNILQATHMAMEKAVEVIKPNFVLVDGLPVNEFPYVSKNIVKGDSKSISIAAASVIAKVKRDKIMSIYDEIYPNYGFSNHKGYGTAGHLNALKELGPSPIHRRSFRPVAELDQLDLL